MLLVVQTALELGFLYAPVALALFLSFRVLNIADMTTDGAFTLGCAVSATFAGFSLSYKRNARLSYRIFRKSENKFLYFIAKLSFNDFKRHSNARRNHRKQRNCTKKCSKNHWPFKQNKIKNRKSSKSFCLLGVYVITYHNNRESTTRTC